MASTFVGSFTVPAATGNKVVTGCGFTPKAVAFWGNRRSADGVSSSNSNADETSFFGVAVSSTQRGCASLATNWTASRNIAVTNACVRVLDHSGTVLYAADFVSLDADGFTVNFSTANATAYVVNFLAIGGSDVSAAVLTNTSPAGTGTQAWTGAGFTAKAVLLAHDMTTIASDQYSNIALGAADSTTSRWGMHSGIYAGAQARYTAYSTAMLTRISESAGTISGLADLSSLDADGFTLNWSTAATGRTLIALVLGGTASYKAGLITQKTSTGTQAATGVGFQPAGLLLCGAWMTVLGSVVSGSAPTGYAIGAASSTTARAVQSQQEGSSTGVARLDRANVYSQDTDSSTTRLAAADFSSFDADGFTLNYGTADAVARYIGYLAIQGAAAAAGIPNRAYQFNQAVPRAASW